MPSGGPSYPSSKVIRLGNTIVGAVELHYILITMIDVTSGNRFISLHVYLEFIQKQQEERDKWKDNKLGDFFNTKFLRQLEKSHKATVRKKFTKTVTEGSVAIEIKDRDFSSRYYSDLRHLLSRVDGITDMVIGLLKRIDFEYKEQGSKVSKGPVAYSRRLRRETY